MKILCAYSSLTFECEHFPGYLNSRETCHPIFHVPQKKLISYLGRWATGTALTPTDSYLLFLAILKSTDLVNFRVPAVRTDKTPAIIANNMEFLCKTVIKISSVINPAVVFPQYVVSQDTKTLENVRYWIENWAEAYQDFLDGYKSAHESQKIIQRERALERLIKNPHKPISVYASQLAEWAAVAGEFPTFVMPNPFSGIQISCADYWKLLIYKASREESLFSIRREDLVELLEHCEDHIPIGSIYSHKLFEILRHALERQRNFLELGDFDISKSSYSILSSSDSVESANIQAMIQAAPKSEPKPEQYPNRLAYLKAKMRWDMSQKYSKPEDDKDAGGEL